MEGAQSGIQTIRYPVVDTSEIMEIRDEIVEETCPMVVDNDKIYVAVGKNLKESQPTLQWVIDNSGGRHICILHVHQPPEKIPFSGIINAHQVVAYHKAERQHMLKLLEKYNQICQKAGVCAEVQYIEMDSIEKGIVEFIREYNVRSLVMGAAADRQYSRRMVDLRSKKAIYVRLQAAASCQIQFICKGNIIFTRPGRSDGLGVSRSSSSLLPNTTSNPEQNTLLPRSVSERQNTRLQVNGSTQDYRRVMSDIQRTRRSTSLQDFNVDLTLASRFYSGSASDKCNGISQRTHSSSSRLSTCSSEVIDDSALIAYAINEVREVESDFGAFKEHVQNLPPSSVIQERDMNDEFYDQLVQAMAEAENSKREAFEESIRRRKAEKDAIEAKRRARASENFYAEEYRRRREIEEMLEKNKEEHEKIFKKVNEAAEELRITLDQKSVLEGQIADFDHKVQKLEQKVFSSVELLQNYKRERDELQIEYDDALRVVEELKKKQANEASSSSVSQLYTEFDFSEVKDATQNFDPFFKIGEGCYGSTFRGFIRHTEVAIKMLHLHNLQGPSVFQQEINVLSKMRHPNLVTLIGACPDAWIIIYEYLSGGSLEDRLECKNNTSPLSWQHRIHIAAELCSVLIFLHSCGIFHGNLKLTNLLLDRNLVTKLSDFRTCHVLSQNEFSSNNTSLYMDPEFLSTRELTSESDTYSFGVILLRLLTGKPALGLTTEVQLALNNENLKNILDSTAGDWPFVQAQQLALLAMNCCDVVRENRPDLATEVWRVLEPMRISCGPSSFRLGSEGQRQVPNYFVCPIFQEIMQDPVVFADGYTYEAEAIKGWLDSGHNTSPMTNLKLANSNLVPNYALRSAIQEWLQQS